MGDHPLLQGTKRVSVFTGSTPTQGGEQVSDTNPFPVKIGDGSAAVGAGFSWKARTFGGVFNTKGIMQLNSSGSGHLNGNQDRSWKEKLRKVN